MKTRTGTATAAGPVPPVMNGAPGIAVAGGAHGTRTFSVRA